MAAVNVADGSSDRGFWNFPIVKEMSPLHVQILPVNPFFTVTEPVLAEQEIVDKRV